MLCAKNAMGILWESCCKNVLFARVAIHSVCLGSRGWGNVVIPLQADYLRGFTVVLAPGPQIV